MSVVSRTSRCLGGWWGTALSHVCRVLVRRHRAASRLQGGVPPPPEGLSRLEVQEQEAHGRLQRSEGSEICHRLRSADRFIVRNGFNNDQSPARIGAFSNSAPTPQKNAVVVMETRDTLAVAPPVFPSISGCDETPRPKNAAKRLRQILL